MNEARELLMITVSGKDRPGITAAMTRVMADHGVDVVDIEQASLQDLLGLSFLIDFAGAAQSPDSLLKDLLFEASRMNLTLNFRLFSPSEVLANNNRSLFVLTFFGGTRALAEFSAILGEEHVNIESISSPSHHAAHCVEMVNNVVRAESLSRLKRRLMVKSRDLDVDLALQKMEAFRKSKRLVFFDMDNTLLDMEVIDEMARRAGVEAEVARITEKAMRGDLDFEESLRQRVALLKGLPLAELEDIRANLRLSEDAARVVDTLKRLGFKVGVVTGGFYFFAEYLKDRLGLDFVFANRLDMKDDALTGRVVGDVIDAAGKARIVNQTAASLGISLDQTVAVGDGANDALMLGQAGLGMAYNAKPVLARAANVTLGKSRLYNILYLLGMTDDDL